MGPLYMPVEDVSEIPATETPTAGAPAESEPAGNTADEDSAVRGRVRGAGNRPAASFRASRRAGSETSTSSQRYGLPGLDVGVFEGQQAEQARHGGWYWNPRRGQSDDNQ